MKKVDKFFIIILLLLQTNFFDLVQLSELFLKWNNYANKELATIIIICYFLLKVITGAPKKVHLNFNYFIMCMLTAWILLIFGTSFSFNQSLLSSFSSGYYFLILLFYYVLSWTLDDGKKWLEFTKIYVCIATLDSIIKIAQSFLLSHGHGLIFSLNVESDYNTAMQFKYLVMGFTRIPAATDFVFIGVIFSLIFLALNVRMFSTSLDCMLLIINVFYVILVGQSRSYLLVLLLMVTIYIYIKVVDRIGVTGSILILCCVGVPLSIGLYTLASSILFSNSDRVVSLSIRQSEIQYYLEYLGFNNWFSLGFADPVKYGNLLHGYGFTYYLDDVGLFSFLGRFGYLGFLILFYYGFVIVKAFKKSRNKLITLMLIAFLIGSFSSVSLFDPQRIMYLPILLSLFDLLVYFKKENLT